MFTHFGIVLARSLTIFQHFAIIPNKMRTANHILIRNVLLFYFDQNKSAADAFRDLNETYGDGTISRAQCFQWFARFKEGVRSLEDKKGRGRPSDFDDQALLDAVEEE